MQLICGVISLTSLMLAFIGACLYAYLAEKEKFGPNKQTVVAIVIAILTALLVNIFIISLAHFLEIG